MKKRNVFTLLLLFGILLLPVPAVEANAGPPPTDIWLRFEYETPTELEGFQLWGCESPDCTQTVCESPGCEQVILLDQYGVCDAPGCLSGEPEAFAVQDADCVDEQCVVNLYLYDFDLSAIKIVGQFSDGVRESEVFSEKMFLTYTARWEVLVQEHGLAVSFDGDWEKPFMQYDNFFGHYAFTVVTELVIVVVVMLVWQRVQGWRLFQAGIYVLLANIISYPVTWLFWPSLSQFQPDANRSLGWGILILAGLYAVYLVFVSFTKDKARLIMTILAFVLIPVVVFIAFLIGLATGYGNSAIAVQGIPFALSIVLAEIFAVVFETVIIYLLARKPLDLKWWQVAIITLVANAASYGLGLVVL